jgi:hypothetical protein
VLVSSLVRRDAADIEPVTAQGVDQEHCEISVALLGLDQCSRYCRDELVREIGEVGQDIAVPVESRCGEEGLS